METRKDLKYSKTHEWIRLEGSVAVIGITDFAQNSLGDIVFVELPKPGKEIKKDDDFGIVESVKAVSDLYAPLSGKVIAVNEALETTPEQINSSPYDSWIIKLELSHTEEADELLDEAGYISFCEQEG